MIDESVSPKGGWPDWLRPFDQDAEEEKEREDGRSDDLEQAAMRPRIRDIGKEPTDKEIEEHYIHHSEFRQWCPHCVKGKAVSFGSKRKKEDESGLPTISIDYMFMGDKQVKEEEQGMPILVMKDRRSKVLWARVVPAKGINAHAVKQLGKQIEMLGYKRILFKSDG